MDERHAYAILGIFVLFGLWMYTINTVHIRRTALRKERLQTRVKTLCAWGAQQLGTLSLDTVGQQPSLAPFLASIERMRIGDEYLFILDTEGRTWADGSQEIGVRPTPKPEGTADEKNHTSPLSSILATAARGGGFVTYNWKQPSTGDVKPKLAYVAPMPNTPLLIGSGTYA